MQVTFLGTGGAIPSVERNVSGLMFQREGELLLFDCGEGTQRQMMRYSTGFTLNDLFVSHFHADHILGVPGLLRTMGLQGRTEPLRLYGPRGADKVFGELVALGMDRPKFGCEIVELSPGDSLDRGEYSIEVGEARHKGRSLCFAINEHDRLGRFDPELARQLSVPEGPLWGQIHRGETVTLEDGTRVAPGELVGPPRPGRRIALSGDTAPCPGVLEIARGADLLVHEATFGQDELVRAKETRHSTAQQAAEVALEAGVDRLALNHISARYSREAPELAAEARSVFAETVVAQDGMTLVVDFPEA